MSHEELLKAISCEPSTMAKVEKVLEMHGKPKTETVAPPVVEKDTNKEGPLDDRAQAALKAVVRILTPFKEALSPLLLHQVLDAAGIQVQSALDQGDTGMAKTEKSATMSPEKIKEEHKIEALKIGKAAEMEHLKKLGYQKYPEEQIAQKGDEKGQSEEQEGTMNDPDVEKSAVAKMDLTGVPDNAKRALEAVFKAHEKATADLKSELDAVKRIGRRKDLVQKAATQYPNLGLPTEEVADMLLALEGNPALEKVEKMLSTANAQAKTGGLFSERGSSHPSGHIGSTWEAIEKAAEGYVAKSGVACTTAQAVDKFLETSEGKRMYELYMTTHPSSK